MSSDPTSPKKNFILRFLNLNTSRKEGGRGLPLWRQLLLQIVTILIAIEVMFPIMYIITMSFSSESQRPSKLQLFPKKISLKIPKSILRGGRARRCGLTAFQNSGKAISVFGVYFPTDHFPIWISTPILTAALRGDRCPNAALIRTNTYQQTHLTQKIIKIMTALVWNNHSKVPVFIQLRSIK